MIHRAPGADRYGWTQFIGDTSGGVIAALIALPYGLAMASLMGLPPVLGLFTSILTAPAASVMTVNAVLAVAMGCSLYAFRAVWVRWKSSATMSATAR